MRKLLKEFYNACAVPEGLEPLKSREVRHLGTLLLDGRLNGHGLEAKVLLLSTSWRSLLWSESLHQAVNLLWTDQLARLAPRQVGSYALPAQLRQMLDASMAAEIAANNNAADVKQPLGFAVRRLALLAAYRTCVAAAAAAGGAGVLPVSPRFPDLSHRKLLPTGTTAT